MGAGTIAWRSRQPGRARRRVPRCDGGRAFDVDLDTFRAEMRAHFQACPDSEDHHRAMAALRAGRAGTVSQGDVLKE